MVHMVKIRVPKRKRGWSETKLEIMASQRGTTPVALLAEVLGRHSTLANAASEFGVSPQTLYKWLAYWKVELVEDESLEAM